MLFLLNSSIQQTSIYVCIRQAIIICLFQVHCLQFLIYEVVSGGNLRKPGGLFGNSGSEIPASDLKQLETFFYKLSFFLHILDYSGSSNKLLFVVYAFSVLLCSSSTILDFHFLREIAFFFHVGGCDFHKFIL